MVAVSLKKKKNTTNKNHRQQTQKQPKQETLTTPQHAQPQPSLFFFQAEDGIRDGRVTGVQTCALPILEEEQPEEEAEPVEEEQPEEEVKPVEEDRKSVV